MALEKMHRSINTWIVSVFHITNGDAAVRTMRQAGISGEILPWRDVLHEGPTPAGLAIEDMSKLRARFIADCGWASFDEAWSRFRERDAMLAGFHDHEEVILWFEHDLYDQLQLLQLLDYFSERNLGRTALSLICVDEYLGLISPQRMSALNESKRRVTAEQLRLGKRAWSMFCAPNPGGWQGLIREDTSALPFLAGAVLRHLEQYPSLENGLNRTEAQILDAVRSGIRQPGRIFEADQAKEERRFMGDSTFWIYMKNLFESGSPLLKTATGDAFTTLNAYPRPAGCGQQEILLTQAGAEVLRGDLDWIAIRGIDKWLGGVHLTTEDHWRWDGRKRRLLEGSV